MLAQKSIEALPTLVAVKHIPCVSILMPFEPKMSSRLAVISSLKKAAGTIKNNLYNSFPKDIAGEILHKLQNVFEHLDYTTLRKSLAIYISGTTEKVYYLDIPVEEKITTGIPFRIRDVLMNKIAERSFLVLVIGEKNARIYVATGDALQLITSNSPGQIDSNLPLPAVTKEGRLKSFFHYIDNSLSNVLRFYALPLFLLTTRQKMNCFASVTKHQKNISGCVYGNFDNATHNELLEALRPRLKNWNVINEKHLLQQLKTAEDENRLATGMHDVRIHAGAAYKQLLVVEKDFHCAEPVTAEGEKFMTAVSIKNMITVRDAVDDIIEKVLKNGGDVDFVDELTAYNRIAIMDRYDGV